MLTPKEIGKRIRSARIEKNMTMQDVADKIGAHKTTVMHYEKGDIERVKAPTIEKLADALGVTSHYLLGWEIAPPPTVTDEYVTFPVIGDVAAGYDHIAVEDWEGDTIDIPQTWLKGRKKEEYFVLRVIGDSMFPEYQNGDKVLVLKQSTMDYSGQVGVVIYNGDNATLKRVEYKKGEDWMRLVPINPVCPPVTVQNEELESCRVLGIPKYLIRDIAQ